MSQFITASIALLVSIWLVTSSASAEIYRYRDADGNVHAVSSLDMVPAEHRKAAWTDAKGRSGGSGGSVNIVEVPTRAAKPAETPAASAPSGPPQTEDWWRSMAIQKQRAVEDAQAALEAAEKEEEDWTGKGLSPGGRRGRGPGVGPGRRRGRGNDVYVGEDEPTVEELQTALGRAERDLSDFNERARKAAVPPGWLR
jgi:hypothetical protein